MRYLLIILLSFNTYASIKEFDHDREIQKIFEIKSKKQTHKKLIELRAKNQEYKKFLYKDKSYKPDALNYVIVLDNILAKLPSKLESMPTCYSIVAALKNDYKSSWEDLPAPTFKVWKLVDRICKKK